MTLHISIRRDHALQNITRINDKVMGAVKSEDIIPKTLDKCVTDLFIKSGSGLLTGAALSLMLFRRRMWPLTMGFAAGIGVAIANCQNKINSGK